MQMPQTNATAAHNLYLSTMGLSRYSKFNSVGGRSSLSFLVLRTLIALQVIAASGKFLGQTSA